MRIPIYSELAAQVDSLQAQLAQAQQAAQDAIAKANEAVTQQAKETRAAIDAKAEIEAKLNDANQQIASLQTQMSTAAQQHEDTISRLSAVIDAGPAMVDRARANGWTDAIDAANDAIANHLFHNPMAQDFKATVADLLRSIRDRKDMVK